MCHSRTVISLKEIEEVRCPLCGALVACLLVGLSSLGLSALVAADGEGHEDDLGTLSPTGSGECVHW
jgi:hypothetical protein